jgi:UPF0755 protein
MSRVRSAGGISPLRRLVIMGISALLTLLMVLALVAAWAIWTYQGPGPEARDGKMHVVMLRRGSGLNEIASSLEKAGVVRSAPVFLAAAQITGAARELKAGEYEFPTKAPMSRVLGDIRAGKVVRHTVTIPEGWTSDMVVELLMKQDALTGDVATPPEGSILPETYDYERGEERAAVLQRMMDDRDELLAALWAKRKPGLPIRTPEEAVILASIVEKETGKASERPRVAAVFVNRLNKGIRLQSDPTIIYGLTKGRPLGRGIRRSELDAPNPYSTYQIDGLPPTPIANPGRASLAAVLDPPETDELFFVADGTGGHVFSSTLEAHNRNVEKWRGVERQRAQGKAPATAPPVNDMPEATN